VHCFPEVSFVAALSLPVHCFPEVSFVAALSLPVHCFPEVSFVEKSAGKSIANFEFPRRCYKKLQHFGLVESNGS